MPELSTNDKVPPDVVSKPGEWRRETSPSHLGEMPYTVRFHKKDGTTIPSVGMPFMPTPLIGDTIKVETGQANVFGTVVGVRRNTAKPSTGAPAPDEVDVYEL